MSKYSYSWMWSLDGLWFVLKYIQCSSSGSYYSSMSDWPSVSSEQDCMSKRLHRSLSRSRHLSRKLHSSNKKIQPGPNKWTGSAESCLGSKRHKKTSEKLIQSWSIKSLLWNLFPALIVCHYIYTRPLRCGVLHWSFRHAGFAILSRQCGLDFTHYSHCRYFNSNSNPKPKLHDLSDCEVWLTALSSSSPTCFA